ncbi:hypothetical protein EXIGLDRAFT_748273 [Exidia glandulosa HHB12029]|uniref:Rad21/Rec8-like protein N-terminal domain-containing protein n=1 Tax=Exidia glandulosa HHB12029 TaxID=1314781 RepID=A0A165JNP5_EXIGL|nr:hypothetical protein EXIGLDRAFT_748273 [Exidia glandulosa HHB12029]
MFFSTELLAKRDGGFGLLWLAATLGPKSSFTKLPRRSVLNADISELCDLIAEPKEPLSLRLSSNLMVGAARVYRVKHDIFLADVNTCFTSLKKAVQDLRTVASAAALEMNNPIARPEALNVSDDPGMGRAALEIDFLAPTWDDWISRAVEELELDDDYNPVEGNSKPKTPKSRAKQHPVKADNNNHTLSEPHLHLLGDISVDLLDSSSQPNASFNLPYGSNDDALFFGGEDLGLDLGVEWEYPTLATIAEDSGPQIGDMAQMDLDIQALDNDVPMDMDVDMRDGSEPAVDKTKATIDHAGGRKRPHPDEVEKENSNQLSPGRRTPTTPRSILVTPSRVASDLPDDGATMDKGPASPRGKKNAKTVRVLFDKRTELSDEEMKRARELYVEEQNKLRAAELAKKQEKDVMRRIDEMIWAPPETFRAPELLEFWNNTFKVQVETRSGVVHLDHADKDRPRSKRRRLEEEKRIDDHAAFDEGDILMMDDFGGFGVGEDFDMRRSGLGIHGSATPEAPRRGPNTPSITGSALGLRTHGSATPEAARRASEPLGGGLALDVEFGHPEEGMRAETQDGNLFPWDGVPGFASSSTHGGYAGLRTPSVGDVDVARLSGGRSLSRSAGMDSPAMRGSLDGLRGLGVGPLSEVDGLGDFQLDLNGGIEEEGATQSQSQTQNLTASQSLADLERNSYKFFEYTKSFFNGRDAGTTAIDFDVLVPAGSPRRHAATAFYHCLLLATKNLITVSQSQPHAPIEITVLQTVSF